MKLKDIIEEYISGDWGNEDFSPETPCAVYCVRGADIVPISNDQFNDIPLRYVSKRTKDNKTLRAGDLVIEKSGGSPVQSTGRITYISQELIDSKQSVVCSNFCTSIRIKDSWNSKFIYYYWQYIYNSGVFFNFEGKTSGLKNLQFDNAIASIDIPEYTLEQQTEIADILSKLESKMTVNREINRNLEAMTRQLYDYWFVQFDFPDENGCPYKSSGGRMVWNEKLSQFIPECWNVKSVGEIASLNKSSLSKKDSLEELLYLDTSNLTLNHIDSLQVVKRSEAPSRAQRRVAINTILYSTVRPRLKHFGIICSPENNLIASTGFCTINANLLRDSISLYLFLTQETIINKLGDIADTAVSSYPSIGPTDIESLYICYGPDSLMDLFYQRTSSTFISIEKNEQEIKYLQDERDELLPLLMNGQVSVMPPEVNCDLYFARCHTFINFEYVILPLYAADGFFKHSST